MGLLYQVNTSVEQLLRAEDLQVQYLVRTLELELLGVNVSDQETATKMEIRTHLAILLQSKCFAKDKSREHRVVIRGNGLPRGFHHKMP